MKINATYKMYTDTKANKDPDTYSDTLHSYHHRLWSKKLPNGRYFKLEKSASPPHTLCHSSIIGDFRLSSDSIIHTYSRWKRMINIIKDIDDNEIREFYDLASTIGGYVVFPADIIDRKPTINGIRGMHPLINDRFDLTLECIRLWYLGKGNPLSEHLNRYSNFFNLFESFKGYVDFFLLNDLVDSRYENINFWLPFEGFGHRKPIPKDILEYKYYMKNTICFTRLRNKRILEWDNSNS
jgi:hypothetical protein